MARKKTKRTNGRSGGIPTDTEWNAMDNKHGKFIITEFASEREIPHTFAVGDFVSVLPPNLPAVEDGPCPPINMMWLAVIRDVRTRPGQDETLDVWARVQWLYSKDDVKKVVQSFDTAHIGANERLLSDHYDYVHASSLNDVIPISRYLFDPTYEDTPVRQSASSTSRTPSEQGLRKIFYQKEIHASVKAENANDDSYPDSYFRYDFEVNSRRFYPKFAQYTCFSATSSSLYHDLNLGSCPHPNSKQSRAINSCFAGSLYSPPDSDRALKIGREVALLVYKATQILESAVIRISQSRVGHKSIPPATPKKRCSSRLQPSPSLSASSPASAGTTLRSYSTTTRAKPVQQTPSASSTKRPRISASHSVSSASKSRDSDALIHTTTGKLLHKMQQAILLEDTLAMHVCPRTDCTGPRGRAWHRSCLIRDKVEVVGIDGFSGQDGEAGGDYSVHAESPLQNAGAWILGDARRTKITRSSPTLAQVQASWEAMSQLQQDEVERMLQLLSTVPPGYSSDTGAENYEFPVTFDLGTPPPQGSNGRRSSARRKERGERKDRTQASDQEELEVLEDLLPPEIPRRRSTRLSGKDQEVDQTSQPLRKRRRSSNDEMNLDVNDNDEDSHIPQIIYSLSLLLAPELVCLASQPMVRGGILPTTSTSSPLSALLSPNSATITGNITPVSRARIAIYKALDGMSIMGDYDIPEKQALVVPKEWANYIVELEGREWLFELLYSNPAAPQNSSHTRSKSWAPHKALTTVQDSSSDGARNVIISRTHTLLRQWQLSRRKVILCPYCKDVI